MIDATSGQPAPPKSVRIAHDDIQRGGRVVVRAGELEVPSPSVVGLIGANGSGKTTLLHSIARVLGPPDRVRVTINGRPHGTAVLVPQLPALPHWLTMHEIFDLAGVHHPGTQPAGGPLCTPSDPDIEGLRGVRSGTYSAGQRQTIAILSGLMIRDPLTLLDEPMAHLDLRTRGAMIGWIRGAAYRGAGVLTVISSHSPVELAGMCDWIVAIRHGQYSFSGPTSTLLGTAGAGKSGDVGDPLVPPSPGWERRILDLV